MIRFATTSTLALVLFVAACGGTSEPGTDMKTNTNPDMTTTPADMTVVPPTFDVPAGCTSATVNLTTAYAIIGPTCAKSNCHADIQQPLMGPNMAAFRSNVLGVSTNRLPASLKYVVASDLNNSMIAYKITGQQDKVQFGGAQMPSGLPPLSAADQCTIINWIRSGASN